MTVLQRLRSMLGPEAVIETDRNGLPRAAPRTEPECALILRAATEERWRVRIEGTGGWIPEDAPADLAVSTRMLTRIPYLDANDLVATAEAGIRLQDLRTALADQGAWLAIDAPGKSRTLGSVVATGTAGSLRTGFGPVRDHVLGLSLVTGDGRLLRAGGRVVKNVAGFDIPKLATGSFGGFGIVTSVHLRLRAVPRADISLLATATRDALLSASRAILDAGATPAALDVASPGATDLNAWVLAIRLLGSDVAVAADREIVSAAAPGLSFRKLDPADGTSLWRSALASADDHPVTVRVGTLPAALDDALDMIAHHLDDESLVVQVKPGVVRWSGSAPADRLRLLRHAAAQREMPVTLERAPWHVRQAVGHFGAYREGVGRLVDSLRSRFDPAGVLVVPIQAEEAA